MSQEWDIDDILASLDELLEEGKADENSDKKPSSFVHVASEKIVEKNEKEVEVKVAPTKQKNAFVEDKRKKKVKLKPPQRLDIDVPDANFRQEPNVDGLDEAPILPRVVLTQDMMVEQGDKVVDIFSPLLDAMHDEEAHEHEVVDEKEILPLMLQEQGIHLNAQQVEHVLTLVSTDISDQFKQLLPDMIRQSLHIHLNKVQAEQQNKQQKNEKS